MDTVLLIAGATIAVIVLAVAYLTVLTVVDFWRNARIDVGRRAYDNPYASVFAFTYEHFYRIHERGAERQIAREGRLRERSVAAREADNERRDRNSVRYGR